MFGARTMGSVDDNYFCHLIAENPASFLHLLARTRVVDHLEWSLQGDPAATLDQLVRALRLTASSGVARQWRDELLVLRDADNVSIGVVERGAARLLGISTCAVHLVGCDEKGRTWIQQRSWKKSIDPGKWDTLMGGMISAVDTLESALERETWEEAGIQVASLIYLRPGGQVALNKPNLCDGGIGYVNERIDWFECLLPDHVKPVNQDGEVERFALVSQQEIKHMLEDNQFTTEAALILVRHLFGISVCMTTLTGL